MSPLVRPKLARARCDEIVQAEGPSRPITRGMAGLGLLANGKRILVKLDHPRQLALMHSLVRFCHLAAEGTFTTKDLCPQTLRALGMTAKQYKLGSTLRT